MTKCFTYFGTFPFSFPAELETYLTRLALCIQMSLVFALKAFEGRLRFPPLTFEAFILALSPINRSVVLFSSNFRTIVATVSPSE